MTWRDRLREAVRRSGVTQREIARRAGLAPESLSRILSGKVAQPEFATVVRIARAARVRVGWLLDEPLPAQAIVLPDRDRAAVIAAGVILLDALRRTPK